MLSPIWDEAADKIAKEFESGKVVVGKVDCDKHGKLSSNRIISYLHRNNRRLLTYHIFLL